MTVVTVRSNLKVAKSWSIMFIFTLEQSHTHVDTVQTVLDKLANSRHICWSHTTKVLGSRVTFVRRNLVRRVTLKHIYFVTKVWSRMFAVNVQRVSLLKAIWNVISWNTLTSNSFAAVHVVNILNINALLKDTSVDVLSNWDINQFSSYWRCLMYSGKTETENWISVQSHISRDVTGRTVAVNTRSSTL